MELVRAGKLTGGVVLRKVLYCEVQERQFDAFWNSENGVASPAPRDFFYLDVLKGDYQEFYLRLAGILSARDDALVDVFATCVPLFVFKPDPDLFCSVCIANAETPS